MSNITTTNAESPSLSLQVKSDNGESVQVLYASCYMRPGASLSLNIEIQDPALVEANRADVQAQLTAFVKQVMERAQTLGILAPKME